MIEVITVQDWTELLDALYWGAWDDDLERFRSPYAFRGLADARWEMPTSLMRLGGDFGAMERHLLRNFRKYAHRDVVERESFWYWLSVAQHHGLPTRLLDWTYSPLVALHFATENTSHMSVDGAVWCVDFTDVHTMLPSVLGNALQAEGSNVFTVDLLAQFELSRPVFSFGLPLSVSVSMEKTSISSLEDFDSLSSEAFLLFFEPPSIDDRIVNQFALFSVMSGHKIRLDEWLDNAGVSCRKVIVPSSLKWEVRDKLDQSNVTERVLFPGLDGLSSWLRRHYGPRS